jgi:excinuclease ABC subunit C
MTENLKLQIESLPEREGVFCFYADEKQPLFIGVAKNIKLEVKRILSDKNSFLKRESIARIEFSESANKDLIKLFAEIVRRKKPLYNISLSDERLYPYLKITLEEFPRLLVTRKIETDQSDYFGAFLPETGVRFWIDFLNRTFRLRSCTIPIDGNFPLPCTQFYEKRCVAPCVKNLCDKNSYDKFVELVRFFLKDDRENLKTALQKKIESAAEILDFETASFWRDILLDVQNVWDQKELQLWLGDAVDSFEIERKDRQILVYLVTQRGRKNLGKRVFVFEEIKNLTPEMVLSQTLWQLYQFHAPKEIRVTKDFHDRKFLAEILSRRENRKIEIKVVKNEDIKITAQRAFGRTKFEFDFRQIKPPADFRDIQNELKKEFNLKKLPQTIECFDVAHISGTNFVAAKAIWKNGKFLERENNFWLLDETSELGTLEKGIQESFAANGAMPDLVLIDGGKPQLNAARKALEKYGKRNFTIISAVKPPRRHNEVSHFISESGEVIQMKPDSEAMQMLVRLRDEAHDFANHIHRVRRDTTHFYESANVLPLIVPIRFDDANGDAKSLQPLRLMHKKRL